MNYVWEVTYRILDALENFLKNFMPHPEDDPQDLPMNQEHADRLYKVSLASIGIDVSPDDRASDQLGCMESVSQILKQAFPELNFPLILSTREAYMYFTQSPSFREIGEAKKGVIILNVTGTGNGKVSNGHVGICGKNMAKDGSINIMSNNSYTGKWDAFYSLTKWNKYFRDLGGMPTHFFERV